ncbi:MAG: PEGA domain-containing protein [Nitrospinota bacterium]|nr:PEGA domain-containing protein [Nitrospinota bacterium]
MVQYTKLGRYEITRELGRGGMGIVLQARDPMIDRLVALKIIKFDDLLEPERKAELLERFFIEARAAGKLTHPNIVTIHDVSQEDETYFITMEFLEGHNLADILRQEKKLDFQRATKIILQVASGLKFAHDRHTIHRDIKPGNIMLMEGDHVKIMDFGLARLQEASSVTQTGHAVGSPQYMSPEQVRGQHMDGRTDIFSLGVMYYELITGARPFAAESITSLMYKIMDYNPPTPAEINQGLPPAVDQVVYKMMAKKPGDRYQNCGELIADLNLLLSDPDHFKADETAFAKTVAMDTHRDDVTVSVPAQGGPGKSRSMLIGAAMVALLAAAGLYYTMAGKTVEPPSAQVAQAPEPAAPTPSVMAATESIPATETKPPAAEPKPEAPPQTAAKTEEPKPMPDSAITVKSNVAGDVYLDGQKVGVTPLEGFKTAAGGHTLAVKAENYTTWEKSFTAGDGKPQTFTAALELAGGVLRAVSTPSGATVTLDGQKIGVTPLVTAKAEPGEHLLEIAVAGMAPYSQTIKISGDKPLIVSATLQTAMGVLSVKGTAQATLYINGKEAGQIPMEKKLPPGAYSLASAKEGHKRQTTEVEVAAEKTTEVSMELEPLGVGSITVSANPWAKIVIDGQDSGVTPRTFRNITEGEVKVTLVNPGFAPVEKTILVRKDQTTQVFHSFTESAPTATAAKSQAFGSLAISSTPPGIVFLDGKVQGKTPVDLDELSVGSHTVIIKRDGMTDYKREVKIVEGVKTRIAIGK